MFWLSKKKRCRKFSPEKKERNNLDMSFKSRKHGQSRQITDQKWQVSGSSTLKWLELQLRDSS